MHINHLQIGSSLQSGRIDGMDFVRIIGALGIIVFHYACFYTPLHPVLGYTCNFNVGSFWVSMFFAVSGACIVRSYNGEVRWTEYARRRWLGVFPMYYLAYFFVAIFTCIFCGKWWNGIPPRHFLLTLVGMDGYYQYRFATFYLVGEWFIGALLYCYLLFPILRWLLKHVSNLTGVVLLTGTYFLPYVHYFEVEAFRNIWCCCTMFYLGMWSAQYPKILHSKCGLIVSIVVLILLCVVPNPIPNMWLLQNVLGGWIGFVAFTQIGSYLPKNQSLQAVLRHGSALSFPFFLLQSKVIAGVLSRWTMPDIKGGWLILLVTIGVCWICSEILLFTHDTIMKRLFQIHKSV